MTKVVVLGAGHGGTQAAAQLAEAGLSVALFDAGSEIPYERPPLSKEQLKAGSGGKVARLRRESFYADKGIDLQLGAVAVRINRQAHQVALGDGRVVAFDKLVIATGSRPRAFPVMGADLPGVVTLRTLEDSHRIARALQPARRIVIVGAGYIGMEVAAAAAHRGCDVVVLEAQDRVMSRVTSESVSRYFEDLHRAHGTRFAFGTAVDEIRRVGEGLEVAASDGTTFPADLVLVGVGVVPNQDIGADAGLDHSDGLLVDDHARTSDPDIYAIGDVTRFTCPREGVSTRLECVQNALSQADAAVRHLTGHASHRVEIPWFWTVQHDVRLQTAGVRSAEDEVVVRRAPGSEKWSVLYLRAGRLSAIDTIANLRDFTAGKKLIAARTPIDREVAHNATVPLADATTVAF